MFKFNIITAFPKIFDCYFNESIIKRAKSRKLIQIDVHNLRDFTTDKHKTIDDKPYGGGPGMVLKIEPIYKAVKSIKSRISNIKSRKKVKVILFSTRGKKFDSKMAKKFSKLDNLIMICGHYEGVDERVAKYVVDEEISIGDYVLTGGELPAMVVVDATIRHIPGVLGKTESLEEIKGSYPVYSRPEIFKSSKNKKWIVPKVLLSGNHKKIDQWRKEHER